ncbi:hypothetical protein IWQ62_002580 [Dispira parvispora]|uniref:Uncharacterized protein n=1 Tax=Dispira parvispora TaxID=1520584 RepID=A0A9W8AVE5_9FUNG|nr:hypothetical protein IWQ62_002580 [Dispira parvispora]
MVGLRFLAVAAVTLLVSVPALLARSYEVDDANNLLDNFLYKRRITTVTAEVTKTTTVTSTFVSKTTVTVTPTCDIETTTQTNPEPTTTTNSAEFPMPTETRAQFIIFFDIKYSNTMQLEEVRDSFYTTLKEKAVAYEFIYSMGDSFNADVVNLERGSEYYVSKLPQVLNVAPNDPISTN